MGIPSYFSWIVRNHTNIIKKFCRKSISVNNLYLDCNSIIYDVIHAIDFTKLTDTDVNTILSAVCLKIDEYIYLLKPDNNIYIAFDGVAPVAKLDQQRERRYKSLYQNKITRSICNSTDPDPWNTTAITPGTLFMQKLTEKIKAKYNNSVLGEYGVKKIIISCSDEYGEGEHKLFQYIREHTVQHCDTTTIIYGLDADLIMLSLNHLPISSNIYLFRETPHFIKSICADLEPNESYLMDIPALAEIIINNMNNVEETNKSEKMDNSRIYDYIFLCFFLGNDFMPHFPAINIRSGGIEKMLNAYKATIGGTSDILTDGKIIYWKNVKRLVQFLADNEENFLKTEAKNRDRREKNLMPDITNEEKLKKFDSIPMYERSLEKFINPYKSNWQVRYYKTLLNTDINENKRREISTNYLEGLEWTMKYYTTGCPDWRWSYQYNYPPLLYDLVKYIPDKNIELVKQKLPSPVSDLVQLCYVLPKQSLHFLPPNLYKKLLEKHEEWYKTDCTFVWAYCRYFWEAHVVLPHIDIKVLEDFVGNGP